MCQMKNEQTLLNEVLPLLILYDRKASLCSLVVQSFVMIIPKKTVCQV